VANAFKLGFALGFRSRRTPRLAPQFTLVLTSSSRRLRPVVAPDEDAKVGRRCSERLFKEELSLQQLAETDAKLPGVAPFLPKGTSHGPRSVRERGVGK